MCLALLNCGNKVTHVAQVAEERALAGLCGSASCSNPLVVPKPRGTFKIDHRQQRIYRDGEIQFCRCEPVRMLSHYNINILDPNKQKGSSVCSSVKFIAKQFVRDMQSLRGILSTA
jgi:hypothetical protein